MYYQIKMFLKKTIGIFCSKLDFLKKLSGVLKIKDPIEQLEEERVKKIQSYLIM